MRLGGGLTTYNISKRTTLYHINHCSHQPRCGSIHISYSVQCHITSAKVCNIKSHQPRHAMCTILRISHQPRHTTSYHINRDVHHITSANVTRTAYSELNYILLIQLYRLLSVLAWQLLHALCRSEVVFGIIKY